ncbi:unnamed protein product [Parascedosporium putredinis]|uniref:Aldose 1-epimerase n=1 Tax=Parascedosporium putredinis TaxID=1442378 RepID=A0A9P1H2F7_9PEZI|nr:unnamed protein product [Parascedosporium putredinis]CAI7994785.1 unnamed protein product [Parascedosporium putredinis]
MAMKSLSPMEDELIRSEWVSLDKESLEMVDKISKIPYFASGSEDPLWEVRFVRARIERIVGEATDYEAHNGPFLGETIGRVANRIRGATLDSLNGGKTYALSANNGPNNLHGGVVGWGKRIWQGPTPVGIRAIAGLTADGGAAVEGEAVKLTLVDGKEVTVVEIDYSAVLTGDADETVINMTNHSYFNLSGQPTIEGTVVTLASNTYLPVDEGGIPTGGPAPFPSVTANEAFTLGPVDPDIDDCFIANTDPASVPIDTRASVPLALHLSAHHPATGIHLDVLSTEPAFQFYTGKYIDVPAVEGAPARGKRAGFCLEPSRWDGRGTGVCFTAPFVTDSWLLGAATAVGVAVVGDALAELPWDRCVASQGLGAGTGVHVRVTVTVAGVPSAAALPSFAELGGRAEVFAERVCDLTVAEPVDRMSAVGWLRGAEEAQPPRVNSCSGRGRGGSTGDESGPGSGSGAEALTGVR